VLWGVYTEEEGVSVDKGIKGDLSAEAVLREGGVAGGSRGGSLCHVGVGCEGDGGADDRAEKTNKEIRDRRARSLYGTLQSSCRCMDARHQDLRRPRS